MGWMILLVLLVAAEANSATHYIRDGGSASTAGIGSCNSGGSGSWNTANACDQLPATLVRGDTYYIADGSYSGKTFSTANSSTTLITIKKATVADHGTATGWLDTYGDGSATWTSQLAFTSSYWLFDGQTGGGPASWTGPFGFVASGETTEMLFFENGTGNITVQHLEFSGTGSYNGTQAGLRANSCTDCTLSYWYMHDIGFIPFFSGAINLIIEYGYLKNWHDGANHSELCSCWDIGSSAIGTHTFRWNLFTDARSTGGIMWDNKTNHAAELRVYGNVFYKDPAVAMDNCCNGIIGGWTGANSEDFFTAKVYNNTFINIPGTEVLGVLPVRSGSNEARNNLFYTVVTPGGSSGVWQTVTHNHFVSTSTVGTSTTTSSGNPFTNLTTFDFRLTGNTPSGTALASPYNVDMLGNTRTTWTRGAIEFAASGDTTPPQTPTGVFISRGD